MQYILSLVVPGKLNFISRYFIAVRAISFMNDVTHSYGHEQLNQTQGSRVVSLVIEDGYFNLPTGVCVGMHG